MKITQTPDKTSIFSICSDEKLHKRQLSLLPSILASENENPREMLMCRNAAGLKCLLFEISIFNV